MNQNCSSHIHAVTGRRAAILVGFWVVLNVVAWFAIQAYELRALENQFGLRRGILQTFRPHTLTIRSPGQQSATYAWRQSVPAASSSYVRLPVVLFLHGSGERGADNVQQLRGVPSVLTTASSQRAYPCIVVAPQCPEHENWTGFRQRYAESGSAEQDPLLKILDSVLEDPRNDPHRIYLIGYSMGAFEVWQMAADVPDKFAAVVPISGGADVNLAQDLIDIKIGAVHGDADGTCSVDATRDLIAAIRAAGGIPRYWEMKGVGHAAWAPALREPSEVMDWLFQQARQPASHGKPQ